MFERIKSTLQRRAALVTRAPAPTPIPTPPEQSPAEQTPAEQTPPEQLQAQYKTLLRQQIATKWQLIDLIEAQSPPSPALSCPLCGHQGESSAFARHTSHCIFEGGRLERHQCPQCDLIFGPDKMLRLTESQLASEYSCHYQVFAEGDSTDLETRAFLALNPSKQGLYLNWGAGAWSRTLDQLRAQGYQLHGYEPHGLDAPAPPHIHTAPEQLAALRFDGIFSSNVLEHLRHPVRELQHMAGLLKPGGILSHATPCFEYRYEFTRFHLFFFLGRSRQRLAEQAGLVIQDFLIDGDYMNIILRRN